VLAPLGTHHCGHRGQLLSALILLPSNRNAASVLIFTFCLGTNGVQRYDTCSLLCCLVGWTNCHRSYTVSLAHNTAWYMSIVCSQWCLLFLIIHKAHLGKQVGDDWVWQATVWLCPPNSGLTASWGGGELNWHDTRMKERTLGQDSRQRKPTCRLHAWDDGPCISGGVWFPELNYSPYHIGCLDTNLKL
jgi:hypothetical protein